jgi:NADH-quinone oxidoreductase subunit H
MYILLSNIIELVCYNFLEIFIVNFFNQKNYFFVYYVENFIIVNMLFLSLIIPIILSVAYVTLLERKVIGASQLRIGPNNVGFFGLLQPIADGLKLFCKETILPLHSDNFLFLFSPFFVFLLSLLLWSIIPVGPGVVFVDLDLGILFFFAISSLSVYGIIIAGWSSNSNYALLGALRSAAQMISYEVSIGLILISLIISEGSLNLTDLVNAQKTHWFVFLHFPVFVMFFISILAETNRPPFDLPEAEAELVSGYNVEYSAMSFALFFLAEYSNIILMSFFTSLLFFGGWHSFISEGVFANILFCLKVLLVLITFIWIRTTFPRFRFDQLMLFGWKLLLPSSLVWLVLTSSFFLLGDLGP